MNTIISSEQALGQKQVIVRLLSTDDEMQACVRLQQPVWQSSELEVVPHHIFIVAQRIGGQVLAAFEESQMLGFVLAFPGVRTGRIYLHSHMTVVLPEHQNRGIGRQLKLAQRDDALARGIDLIEWTFDPLQLRNAYFNIVRLRVIVRQYLPNVYGRTTSSLDAGLPTDRLVAQWWIREPGVRQVLGNQSLRASGEVHRIRLPRRIREICSTDPERARQVQLRLSEEFQQHLHGSWAVTGFELDEQYGSYLLEQYED